jgi:hypothetical protein
MSEEAYTVAQDEKVTRVMIGTPEILVWGDLVTKQSVRMSVFLNTLAEDFVPLRNVKILFLAPTEQMAPLERAFLFVKLEEILLFFAMHDTEPLPQEAETRRYEPAEVLVGSYQVKGKVLKSPMSTFHNMLLISRYAYIPLYEASVHHIAKPWLGAFSSNLIQVRRDRMVLALS